MKKITFFWSLDPVKEDAYYVQSPSYSMLTLSKVLENGGYETAIVDSSFLFSRKEFRENPVRTIKKLIEFIERTSPDFLAVGSWTFNMPIVAELTKLFKARNPDTPLILGGINPTLLPHETLRLLPHIDYLVRGEGEYTLLELIQKLEKKESVNSVKGISFLKDGKVVNTPDRPQIDNLDDLPIVDLESYFRPKGIKLEEFEAFIFPPSRGCIGNCSFCSICAFWSKPRLFSPGRIIKQIRSIEEKYGLRFNLWMDNLLLNVTWGKQLARELHRNFPRLEWEAQVGLNEASKEVYSFLIKNGLGKIHVGVESISPKILTFFNKTDNTKRYIEKFLKLLDITKELNLKIAVPFILGTPVETSSDIEELDNFIQKARSKYKQLYIDISLLTMFPGTKLWREYKSGKIDLVNAPRDFREKYIGRFLFEEKYSHLPWMIPGAYMFRNQNMPLDKHIELIQPFFDKIGYGEYTRKKILTK